MLLLLLNISSKSRKGRKAYKEPGLAMCDINRCRIDSLLILGRGCGCGFLTRRLSVSSKQTSHINPGTFTGDTGAGARKGPWKNSNDEDVVPVVVVRKLL